MDHHSDRQAASEATTSKAIEAADTGGGAGAINEAGQNSEGRTGATATEPKEGVDFTPFDWPFFRDLWGEYHALTLDLDTHIRYHERRAGFLGWFGRLSNFVGVVFGSAAVASILSGYPWLTAATAGTAAVFSGISLVWNTTDAVRDHYDARRIFSEIEQEAACANVTEARVIEWRRRLQATTAALKEPTYEVVMVMARNDSLHDLERGDPRPVGLLRRLTAHIIAHHNLATPRHG